jgi:HlyD family type I secretion membrane fusion protein
MTESDEISKAYPFRRLALLGILSLVILVGGLGSWAVTAQLSGAVISQGSVRVEQNRQVVQHPDGGVVDEVLIVDGDFVEEGALLIRLDSSELVAERQVVDGQLAEALARLGRFSAERDNATTITFDPLLQELKSSEIDIDELIEGQKRLFEARRVNFETRVGRLQERVGQVESQIDGIEAQQAALVEQLALIAEELENQNSLLAQGLTQATRVLNLRREQSRLQGQAGSLAAQKALAEGQITELDLEVLNQGSTLREEAIAAVRDTSVRVLELRERRRIIMQRLSRLEIRAPVSGVIFGLSVFGRRAVIRSAEPLLYLVPQDQPLVISAKVQPRDIDQVRFDQDVAIKLSGFNQRTTPTLYGRVIAISADSFIDEVSGQPYYAVNIRLKPGEVSRLGGDAFLLPGMLVEVFFATDSRTLMAYLLQPITDYVDRAFRDG